MEFTCRFDSWSTSIRRLERAQNYARLQGPNNDLGRLDYQYERSRVTFRLIGPSKMTFSGATIFTRQRRFKKLPLVSRKFLMRSTHWRTSTQWYRRADISRKMKNPNCMLYFVNTNIYSMVLWGHGITNPIISNLRKVLSHITADLSLFQKFMSAL